jgi:hypothetical protein
MDDLNHTDELDRAMGEALAEADPALHFHPSQADGQRLLRAATQGARPAQRRRRSVVVAVTCLTVLGAGIPGVAFANGYLARTGLFGPDPNADSHSQPVVNTEADGSEWIEITAPDYVEVAVSEWPRYATLPAGYEAEDFARRIAEDTVAQEKQQDPGVKSMRQVTGIRGQFAIIAGCAWRAEWLDANTRGAAGRQRLAADTLTAVAHWPAIVATDGGGVVAAEEALAKAAVAGTRGQVIKLGYMCDDDMLRRVTR